MGARVGEGERFLYSKLRVAQTLRNRRPWDFYLAIIDADVAVSQYIGGLNPPA